MVDKETPDSRSEQDVPNSLPSGEADSDAFIDEPLTKDADLDYFVDRFGPGNLAIVYGVPDQVVDEIVLLKAEYIRIIDAAKVQADQLDYIPKEALNRPVESTSYSN